MKKIMFNDAYGLTQATIEGRKTMTRRNEFDEAEQARLNIYAEQGDMPFIEDNSVMVRDSEGTLLFSKPTRYKIGEVVAVAQSYRSISESHPNMPYFLNTIAEDYRIHRDFVRVLPGWRNKMFVKAELMPYRIRITGMRAERLQDISDADCIKEGISRILPDFSIQPTLYEGAGLLWPTPRAAFAHLINKVSGRGTWDRNPWVVAYEYELIK